MTCLTIRIRFIRRALYSYDIGAISQDNAPQRGMLNFLLLA